MCSSFLSQWMNCMLIVGPSWEPMLPHCHLDHWEHISMKFNLQCKRFQNVCAKCWSFCSGLIMLNAQCLGPWIAAVMVIVHDYNAPTWFKCMANKEWTLIKTYLTLLGICYSPKMHCQPKPTSPATHMNLVIYGLDDRIDSVTVGLPRLRFVRHAYMGT